MNTAVAQNFKDKQKTFPRVWAAYDEKWTVVEKMLPERIREDRFEISLNAYKQEQTLEIWIRGHSADKYTHLTTYKFCASSGALGPKLQEGDLQIPEGTYHINVFNPESSFHLSLGLNYPNRADRIRSGELPPGTDIYIHGACTTVGCISLTDNLIKELYILAVETTSRGQKQIPVNIYPFKMSDANLVKFAKAFPTHEKFWKELQSEYNFFDARKATK